MIEVVPLRRGTLLFRIDVVVINPRDVRCVVEYRNRGERVVEEWDGRVVLPFCRLHVVRDLDTRIFLAYDRDKLLRISGDILPIIQMRVYLNKVDWIWGMGVVWELNCPSNKNILLVRKYSNPSDVVGLEK